MSCGGASTMWMLPRAWRTSSSPPRAHENSHLPPGNSSTTAAPKPWAPPSRVGTLRPDAAADPFDHCLCSGRRLARQHSHDDLVPLNGLVGNTACSAVAGNDSVRRLALHESGLLPPRKPF